MRQAKATAKRRSPRQQGAAKMDPHRWQKLLNEHFGEPPPEALEFAAGIAEMRNLLEGRNRLPTPRMRMS